MKGKRLRGKKMKGKKMKGKKMKGKKMKGKKMKGKKMTERADSYFLAFFLSGAHSVNETAPPMAGSSRNSAGSRWRSR